MCTKYLDYTKLDIQDPMKKGEMKETMQFDENKKIQKCHKFHWSQGY